MEQPDYSAQTGEREHWYDPKSWRDIRIEEAKEIGCTFFKWSLNRDYHLLLLEGWKSEPDPVPGPYFHFSAKLFDEGKE